MIRLSIALAGILVAGWSTPPALAQAGKNGKAADPKDVTKAADQKFDKLLAAAQKDPKWNHLESDMGKLFEKIDKTEPKKK